MAKISALASALALNAMVLPSGDHASDVPDAPTHADRVLAAGGPTDSTVYAAGDDVTGKPVEYK